MDFVDPVCGMFVDENAIYRAVYNNSVYYFCSKKCRDEFSMDPECWLKNGPRMVD
ncbi:MAG: YHS domain-containing protein [Nitrososphaerota archaeon]|jgi:YHS domain-containing protein|nr:YHS domain-containing protein [Nitrososphaerota archaeon]MDG6930444.1 YHS domain-containing protein [Nitrososphaerota archaeon]MDG6931485.1 YHS domain-containing protein [Nitrososphaerota archaeon]MDG6936410.1 YHS domain-containing protein [Nitrososphaerota archaeon]MDG6944769.1 YHS domain-containing protein [Nitrososphaerota archaeon]